MRRGSGKGSREVGGCNGAAEPSPSPGSEFTRQERPAGPPPGPGGRSPGRALYVLSSVEVPSHSAIHAPRTLGTWKRVSPYPRSSGGGAGQSAQSFPESPSASLRDPGPHRLVESRASGSLGSGFPGTHPVPTPESWRPARDAMRAPCQIPRSSPGDAELRPKLGKARSLGPGLSGKPPPTHSTPPKAPGTPL